MSKASGIYVVADGLVYYDADRAMTWPLEIVSGGWHGVPEGEPVWVGVVS